MTMNKLCLLAFSFILSVLSLSAPPAPAYAQASPAAPDLTTLSDQALVTAFQNESEGNNDYGGRGPAYAEILMRGKTADLTAGILGILKEGSFTQKVHAAHLAGELRMEEAVPFLKGFLHDGQFYRLQNLCFTVMNSLEEIGNTQAIAGLTEVFTALSPLNDETPSTQIPANYVFNTDICKYAAYHLGCLGQTSLRPQFLALFQKPHDSSEKAFMAEAAAMVGETSVRDWALGELTKKPNPRLDIYADPAVMVLGYIGNPADMDLLKKAQGDREITKWTKGDETAAMWMVGFKNLPNDKQTVQVAYFLYKKEDQMIPWAIRWLGKNGTPSAIGLLEKYIDHPELAKYQLDMLAQLRHNNVPLKRVKNAVGGWDFSPL
jgi:hypothetical protein